MYHDACIMLRVLHYIQELENTNVLQCMYYINMPIGNVKRFIRYKYLINPILHVLLIIPHKA